MSTLKDKEDRQKKFKNAGRHEEMRRRRTEGSVELRKQKKDEQLMKRRNMDEEDDDALASPTDTKKSDFHQLSLDECNNLIHKPGITETEIEQAIESIRRSLSRNKNPPIKTVIDLGLIPPLIAALGHRNNKIRFEAAWALTNIVSGNSYETAAVLEAGGLPALINALSAEELYVAEQAAWAIGNIAGDSATLRDLVLANGVLPPLLALTNRNISEDFMRTLAWTFSNLCRHKKPHPPIEMVQVILPSLVKLLYHNDHQVVVDALWALSYVTDGPDNYIQLALDNNVLPRIIECLASNDRQMVSPALRSLGNIVTGNDKQTQRVVDTGVLSRLAHFMGGESMSMTKECCWLVSNIFAGNSTQIQSAIDAGLLPHIIQCMEKGDFRTQHEAAWAICNLTSGGTEEQIGHLITLGAIPALCSQLGVKDVKTIHLLLDSLTNILEAASRMGILDDTAMLVEECGGLDKIEQLQQHEDEQIYGRAVQILDKYFEGEDGENGGGVDGLEGKTEEARSYEF